MEKLPLQQQSGTFTHREEPGWFKRRQKSISIIYLCVWFIL